MVYTLTVNPSIDYIVSVQNFSTGKVNRSASEKVLAGGKGINVSTVLNNLGVENVALGFVAGFTGEKIESLLNEKLNIAGIRIDLEMLLPPLKEGIRRTLSGLSDRTAFCSTSCLEWIRTVSSSYEKEYGFTLLDE